jgi:hypothetical protein
MKLISHRGNIEGSNPELENKPEYIEKAIEAGFNVEVDVRVDLANKKMFLGHDEPQYEISIEWLEKYHQYLWLHCKTQETIEFFYEWDSRGQVLNYFWHENDAVTLTSKGYLWCYPGKPMRNGIAVLPEINNDNTELCYGVCSDLIKNYAK